VTIKPSDLPPQVQGRIAPVNFKDNVIEMPVGQRLEDYIATEERKYIEQTMRYNGGSREKTASMLGISMATLYRKLEVKSKRA